MGNITEESAFDEGIYLIEESDLVKGGALGTANKQAKSLANRTLWLKNAQKGFNDLTIVEATKILLFTEIVNRLILVNGTAIVQLTLPSVSIPTGTRAYIQNNNTKAVTIIGDLKLYTDNKSSIVVCSGETIELIWIGDRWIVRDFVGNLMDVGNTFFDYKQRPNTLICNGALVTRADYPRLWEFAQSLGASLIADLAWTTNPTNQGFFSSGNGSSNFRLPDLRSMFIRGLDLSAGVSTERVVPLPGGYEADSFKSHKHKSNSPNFYYKTGSYPPVVKVDGTTVTSGMPPGYPSGGPWIYDLSKPETIPAEFAATVGLHGYDYLTAFTEVIGGNETRPKNIGLIPLIKV